MQASHSWLNPWPWGKELRTFSEDLPTAHIIDSAFIESWRPNMDPPKSSSHFMQPLQRILREREREREREADELEAGLTSADLSGCSADWVGVNLERERVCLESGKSVTVWIKVLWLCKVIKHPSFSFSFSNFFRSCVCAMSWLCPNYVYICQIICRHACNRVLVQHIHIGAFAVFVLLRSGLSLSLFFFFFFFYFYFLRFLNITGYLFYVLLVDNYALLSVLAF